MKPSNALLPIIVLSVIGLPGAGSLFAAEPLPPTAVTGKEYSVPFWPTLPMDPSDPPGVTLSILWDGLGNVMDWGGDFRDAMAHRRDAYFHDVAYRNSAALLVAFEVPLEGGGPISYESPDGSHGTWARFDQLARVFSSTIDGLEVGGPEWVSNTDFYSSALGGPTIMTRTGHEVLSLAELVRAIGAPLEVTSVINLDALMYYRNQSDDSAVDAGAFDPVPADAFVGDEILFSIRPVRLPGGEFLFDGGEIWTYTIGSGEPAQFLDHGGHLWNTEFDVRGTFGTFSDNVAGLEAVPLTPVPEAGTLAASVLLAGLVGLGARSRRSAA